MRYLRTPLIVAALLLASMTLCSTDAAAQDERKVGVIMGSYHLDRQTPYNETNPGFYVRSNNIEVGFYENSLSQLPIYAEFPNAKWKIGERSRLFTAYVGGAKTASLGSWVDVSMVGGVAVGYGDLWQKVTGEDTSPYLPMPMGYAEVSVSPFGGPINVDVKVLPTMAMGFSVSVDV